MTAGPGIEPAGHIGASRVLATLRQPFLSQLHAFVPFRRVFEDSVVFPQVVVLFAAAPFSVITIQGKQTHKLQPLPLFGSLFCRAFEIQRSLTSSGLEKDSTAAQPILTKTMSRTLHVSWKWRDSTYLLLFVNANDFLQRS